MSEQVVVEQVIGVHPAGGVTVGPGADAVSGNPEWLGDLGLLGHYPGFVLVISMVLGYLLVRIIVLPIIRMLVTKSSAWWDDVLADASVLHRITMLVPLVVAYIGVDLIPNMSDRWDLFLLRILEALIAITIISIIGAVCRSANSVYSKLDVMRERPIKGYLQVVRLVSVLIGTIFVISALIGKSPLILLSGLGAMTAVLMLVFRDTILGFVAGVQISTNKLLSVGDWVEMPQFNADGDVIDIALNTVQVQNWDKTITVIPAHKFLENSFKNWRGMQRSGGRRIARSIVIDVSSVAFVDADQRERLEALQIMRPFLVSRQQEIDAWNKDHFIDTAVPGNGRRMTNIGCFRAYVIAYLKNNPMIRQDMTFLVRQLESGPTGLPIQVYVFTSTTVWAEYEAIQSDIFDHLYAIMPHFSLRAFQHPAGADVRALCDARVVAREAPSEALGEAPIKGQLKAD